MADLDPDILAAIAKLMGGDTGDDDEEDENPSAGEAPAMTNSFMDKLASYEKKVNQ